MRKLAGLLTGILILLISNSTLHAQIVRVGSCKVDLEIWELPSCAITQKNGQTWIRKELIRPLGEGRWVKVGEIELAWTGLPSGFSYFNRNGLVVVTSVATFDNGPSPFHSGLVRINRSRKWGLSDANGRMIVPLQYDGILEFEDDLWLACTGCVIETEGEYHLFTGGSWVKIDRFGKVLGAVKDPTHK